MSLAPPPHPNPPHRRSHPLLALVGIVAVGLVTVLGSAVAAAQSTTMAPPVTLPAENPGSTAAGVVFFVTVGAIAVGALLLYLRNRRPRVPTEP